MRTTQPVSMRLPKAWLDELRRKAHIESLKTGREIIYTDLIKAAIGERYPEVRAVELEAQDKTA